MLFDPFIAHYILYIYIYLHIYNHIYVYIYHPPRSFFFGAIKDIDTVRWSVCLEIPR